jgi:hypothetical protein
MSGLNLDARPPAHLNPAWLPVGTRLEGFDGIGEEHRRYLTNLDAAVEGVSAVDKRHKAADAARNAALLEGAHGRDVKMPKEITPAQRAQELRDAEERRDAAQTALCQFLDEATEEIRDSWPSWDQVLAHRAAEAEQERAEAERLLAVAAAKALEIRRLRIHLERTATGGDHWQIAYPDLPAPTPIPQPDLADAYGVVTNA